MKITKKLLCVFMSAVTVFGGIIFFMTGASSQSKDFIKYAEFNVTYSALESAMQEDIESHKSGKVQISWIEVLAYLGAKYGGDFSRYSQKDMDDIISKLKEGSKINDLTKNMKYYSYYHEVYSAVLGGFLGNHTDNQGKTEYGLCVYSPIAKTFPFEDYDDFGASRTYGYAREHLGHDLMCAVGTPIICIEEGTVECLGWNQYGGWRIGIRSKDKKRYYYYAHLRQNRPYHCDLEVGKEVRAGDVIGYAGRTGYSTTENTNNIETPHLHLGIELIFDESQKECDNEIWIDLYAITQLLQKNKSEVIRNSETKEFYSVNTQKQI